MTLTIPLIQEFLNEPNLKVVNLITEEYIIACCESTDNDEDHYIRIDLDKFNHWLSTRRNQIITNLTKLVKIFSS